MSFTVTWKKTYKHYKDFSGRDVVTNYAEVSDKLETALDSAGWFWSEGKALSNANPGIWQAPTFDGIVGTAVAAENPSIPKKIVTYGSNPQQYGVIDFNLLADRDYTDTISWLINGGGNGFNERREYVKSLKGILDYEHCHNK